MFPDNSNEIDFLKKMFKKNNSTPSNPGIRKKLVSEEVFPDNFNEIDVRKELAFEEVSPDNSNEIDDRRKISKRNDSILSRPDV